MEEGYIVLRDIFTKDEILECQKEVIQYLKNHRKSGDKIRLNAGGGSITDFINQKELIKTATMKENPKIQEALRDIFSGDDYRFCSHSGIGINRIVGWHKDKLNGPVSIFETVNIWEEYDGHKHEIVKVLVYLEDHENDNDGLKLVPRSHLNPNINPSGFIQIQPKIGDVIIFDQRITHRGMDQQVKYPRILAMFCFGKNNIFTDNFEKGTVARQTMQKSEYTDNNDKGYSINSKVISTNNPHLYVTTMNGSDAVGDVTLHLIGQYLKNNNKTSINLLDIGGGKGWGSILYERDFINYYCLDLNESKRTSKINYIKGDITDEDLDLETKFDIIFSKDTFEHILNPWEATKNFKKLLKNNGLIMIFTPFSWRYHPSPYDTYRYTHTGLQYLVERLGEIKKIKSGYTQYGHINGFWKNCKDYIIDRRPHLNCLQSFYIGIKDSSHEFSKDDLDSDFSWNHME